MGFWLTFGMLFSKALKCYEPIFSFIIIVSTSMLCIAWTKEWFFRISGVLLGFPRISGLCCNLQEANNSNLTLHDKIYKKMYMSQKPTGGMVSYCWPMVYHSRWLEAIKHVIPYKIFKRFTILQLAI